MPAAEPDHTSRQSELFAAAKAGEISWSEVAEQLLVMEARRTGDHQPDHDRIRRCGFGEVIFGEGKTADSVVAIARRLLDSGQEEVLVTRFAEQDLAEVSQHFTHVHYNPIGWMLRLSDQKIQQASPTSTQPTVDPTEKSKALVAVVSAGSTDDRVAQEAFETLSWMRIPAVAISDVGVAGPYRLLPHLETLRSCAAVVVVAGMEGALASVVGGLVPCPVVAVPTSVGYGSNFEGITTLLSMLSSCAAGVTVVNIDAGFKGGYVSGLIAAKVDQKN